jgi:hypothetical protein
VASRARKGEEAELGEYTLVREGHELAREIYCMLSIR